MEIGGGGGRIRVLFNVWADEENTNAQSLNARDIGLRLDPARFACTFFYRSRPDPRVVGRENIRLVRLPAHLKAATVIRAFLSQDHDVIFYPNTELPTALYWSLAPLLRRRKLVVCPVEGSAAQIGAIPSQLKTRVIENIRRADLAVAITPHIARSMAQQYEMELRHVPIGVDTTFFTPPDRRDRHIPVRVLFVGSLIERKRPHLLVEAAIHLRGEPVEFSLVGGLDRDPAHVRTLQMIIEKEQLTNVHLTGALTQEQTRRAMQEADIFVLPSRLEGLPKVSLEAGASGLPCIVFRDYDTPSVVDGVTGFQVSSMAEMVERIRLLVRDRELRLRMGAAAVEHARQFDWSRLTPQWEELLLAGFSGERAVAGSGGQRSGSG